MKNAPPKTTSSLPLAERLRPRILAEVVGQEHLLGEQALLGRMLAAGRLGSLILWGPPGCGKTTIARLLAEAANLKFENVVASISSVAELRKVFESAAQLESQDLLIDNYRGTLLFIDEIHRFNRAQQDLLLSYTEEGVITLVGATTENPSFALTGSLLSRCRVLTLKRLELEHLQQLLARAERTLDKTLPLTAEARTALCERADGDGRSLLNSVEDLSIIADRLSGPLSREELSSLGLRRAPLHDRAQDSHYNLISAFHKSLRGSDCDAALYWLARLLEGGEDPNYIARRMLRFASEDVGLADPQALSLTLAAWQSYERLGSPEGDLALAEAAIYLATAPKSNAAYLALGQAQSFAREQGSLSPPKHILSAPNAWLRAQGQGVGYIYDHDTPEAFSGQNYFPESIERPEFYRPALRGFEREIRKRLDYWNALRRS